MLRLRPLASLTLCLVAFACADEVQEIVPTADADTEVPPPLPLPPGTCLAMEDCPTGQVCNAGVCVPFDPYDSGVCVDDLDCSGDHVCERATGRCLPKGDEIKTDPPADPPEPAACFNGELRTCGISKIGACRWGVEVCAGGDWAGSCNGAIGPTPETCNGIDDDCNGIADDADLGPAPCPTGRAGICAIGRQRCDLGFRVCEAVRDAVSEACNNFDDDCDGLIDDGNPGGGAACVSAALGECVVGQLMCLTGAFSCLPQRPPSIELCDLRDNDCDGMTDEDASLGQLCATGLPGICGLGMSTCGGGTYHCAQTVTPGFEICNGLDDDCDTVTDEGLSGQVSCNTGLKGICAVGTMDCRRAQFVCTALNQPSEELCNALDDNCDGRTDEIFDADRDGFSTCSGDCDDQNASVYPGRRELCNVVDDNCDGVTDEGMTIPLADAGSDRTVPPPTVALLDGRGSVSPSNASLTYRWTLVSQPAGQTVTITGATSAQATFTANGAGDYVFDLQVTDANGCRSEHDQVRISAVPRDDVHIELTWDHEGDVDLHYIAPRGTLFAPGTSYNNAVTGCGTWTGYSDCNYVNDNPDWGTRGEGIPDCLTGNDPALDVDNTSAMGPENINQDNPFDGTYRVNVHYYCARTYGPTVTTLKVWADGVLKGTWTKTLSNRQNWDALLITVVGGAVTSVGPATDAVTQISQGCSGY